MADRKFRVVLAGAGVSGLFMAEMPKRARIDFAVFEKAGEVGGTWRDNTFPGLFVDVVSRQYEFPFQPKYNWSRKSAPATEIWAHIKNVARERPMNVRGLNGMTIDEAWRERIYCYGGIALPGFPNLFMLYGPFALVNNVPVPLGLDQEIACIVRLIGEARTRRAAVAPTVAATEKFLARLGTAFPGTVWVGDCKNWYTSRQPTPVLWPFPQSEHKAFFDPVPVEDFDFIPIG
jgi:cation diffusion facilitator CzcD-associated flavoprotein CzcO